MERSLIDTIQLGLSQGFKEADLIEILSKGIKAKASDLVKEEVPLDSIHFDTRTLNEIVLDNPQVGNAVRKLQLLKGRFPYQRATGRAAINVKRWIYQTYIEPGYLTIEDIQRIPVSFLRDFDERLYHAIFNSLRNR